MQITEDDLNTERLIEASLVLPTVKVITDDEITDFLKMMAVIDRWLFGFKKLHKVVFCFYRDYYLYITI